jgi:hypothetical protein
MSRLEELAERRREIIAACNADRDAIAESLMGMEKELRVADGIVSVARTMNRHRAMVGAAAAGLLLAPAFTRKWIGKVSGWLPLVSEGYRMFKKLRD